MSTLEKLPNLKKRLADGEKICVSICTPMYGGVGMVDYFVSLMKTKELLQSLGIGYKYHVTKQESLVQRARNTLVGYVLNDSESTHVFFIDADISWNEYDVLLLLENNLDVVGGIYPKKAFNFKKMLHPEEILKFKSANKYNEDIPDETFLKHHLVNYNLNGTGQTKIENGLIEVRHIATGFMMIKRSVFEKMIEAHPEWEYVDDLHVPLLDMKFYSFFDCGIRDKHYMSEDWLFCDRWTDMGGKIYANIIIPLNHTGTICYEGRILSTLQIF